MNTPACEAANRSDIALDAPAKEAMHKRCPGAYRTPSGELKCCGCECHGDVNLDALKGTALPVLEGERVIGTGGGPSHPEKGEKSAERYLRMRVRGARPVKVPTRARCQAEERPA